MKLKGRNQIKICNAIAESGKYASPPKNKMRSRDTNIVPTVIGREIQIKSFKETMYARSIASFPEAARRESDGNEPHREINADAIFELFVRVKEIGERSRQRTGQYREHEEPDRDRCIQSHIEK